jgi:hypothetical protein
MILRTALIAVCLIALPGCSEATPPVAAPAKVEAIAPTLPADVTQFIATRTDCDHFRGEEAYDEARGKFLAEQLEKTCKGSDKALKDLRTRYDKRADVTAALAGFEAQIE